MQKDEKTNRYTVQDAEDKRMSMSEWKKMTLEEMDDYPFIPSASLLLRASASKKAEKSHPLNFLSPPG